MSNYGILSISIFFIRRSEAISIISSAGGGSIVIRHFKTAYNILIFNRLSSIDHTPPKAYLLIISSTSRTGFFKMTSRCIGDILLIIVYKREIIFECGRCVKKVGRTEFTGIFLIKCIAGLCDAKE